MNEDLREYYVDWEGLIYYDQRIKSYIETECKTAEDQAQLRVDLEQLEQQLQSLRDNEIAHIFSHLENSDFVSKEELSASITALEKKIETLTGISLDDYVTDSELAKILENDLAVVAKTGSYNDLSDTPAIPSVEDVRELTTNVTNLNETVANITTQVTELEQNVINNYIRVEDGVTQDQLKSVVSDVVESQVETMIDEKVVDAVTNGVAVSSITYGEF